MVLVESLWYVRVATAYDFRSGLYIGYFFHSCMLGFLPISCSLVTPDPSYELEVVGFFAVIFPVWLYIVY